MSHTTNDSWSSANHRYRHGDSFGDTWPADDPDHGLGSDDPWLSNVNADMGAWLLSERAGLEEDEPPEDDEDE